MSVSEDHDFVLVEGRDHLEPVGLLDLTGLTYFQPSVCCRKRLRRKSCNPRRCRTRYTSSGADTFVRDLSLPALQRHVQKDYKNSFHVARRSSRQCIIYARLSARIANSVVAVKSKCSGRLPRGQSGTPQSWDGWKIRVPHLLLLLLPSFHHVLAGQDTPRRCARRRSPVAAHSRPFVRARPSDLGRHDDARAGAEPV